MNSSHSPELPEGVELLDTPGADKLRLRFDGPFAGRVVRWDATLFIPEAWARSFGEEVPQQNIIAVGEEGEYGISLQLCLKVKRIDLPTIRKAIVMIRQYRRLQHGRHQYG